MSRARVISWTFALAVLLPTLLGIWLRFHELGSDGLWSDELFTSSMITQHALTPGAQPFRRTTVFGIVPTDHFWTAKGAEQSPPLFEILSKASVAAFGASELSLRLVSALAGCAWLLFLAWSALTTDDAATRRTYVFTLYIAAVSLPLVEYSQEARAYGLGTLFTGILTARWFERWREGFADSPTPSWGELLVFVLGCHTHYNVVVLSALLLLSYGVVALRKRDYRGIAKLAIVPLACVPWVALNMHTIFFTAQGGVRWREFGLVEAITGGIRCASELPGASLALVAACIAWFAIGRRAFGAGATPSPLWRATYALATLVIVDVLLVALVTMRAGMQHPRYYLFVLPALHLAIGTILAETLKSVVPAVAVAAALLVFARADLVAYYAQQNEGYREVTRWLAGVVGPTSPVVFTWGPNLAMYRFYLERYFGSDADDRAIPISSPDEARAVCERLGDAPRVALVAHSTHRPLAEAVLAACGDRYVLAGEREIRAVFGQVWKRRTAP